MYIEETLKMLLQRLEEIENRLEHLHKEVLTNTTKSVPEYFTVQQAHELSDWPFTGPATRKMIIRKQLQEGIHYNKVHGRVLLKWSALKALMDKHFLNTGIRG